MKVYLLQFDMAWEQKRTNHATVRQLLQKADVQAGGLVLLPEMFGTGFSMKVQVTAQSSEREDETFLSDLARETGCAVLGGVVSPLGADGFAQNEAVTFAPDGTLLARYAKLQPFTFAGEGKCHRPGSEIVTFDWAGAKVAPFICYDLRFPEHFRAASALGAEVMVVIASWPERRQDHWTTLLKARAIENQAYVIGVNRCGSDPTLTYVGGSVVFDPLGNVIAEAGSGEGVTGVELDLKVLREYRKDFPVLGDSR